jgi:serine protease Do
MPVLGRKTMSRNKFLPVLFLIAGILLSSCSVPGLALEAPAIANIDSPSIQVSAPLNTAPIIANEQIAPQVLALQDAYENIYKNVNPSVVTITISSTVSSLTGRFGGSNGQSGQGQTVPVAEGSGFIWDTSGHIVTNNHVVEGASKITVTFSDGVSYSASVVGTDPVNDLAVIKVEGAPAASLKPVTVADSSKVMVGEMVIAIGNPFGLGNTMTNGVVSATGREIQSSAGSTRGRQGRSQASTIKNIIQTDASINPGNSGGVLLDMNGSLIGVPSQIASDSGSNSGVGFAIPSNTVSTVVAKIIK